ncbi:MAG: MFS transporter [Alphaproteobacteria bacterium]|nr:MFS transporter [Alphaproteobacteria bacterium]
MARIFDRPGFAAFRERDFRLFFGMRFLASMATQMADVAIAWIVYQITNSALALGLIGLCLFLPNIVFLLAAGHAADRYDRRLVLMVCYCANTLVSLAVLYAVYKGNVSAPMLFVAVAVLGTTRAFSSPASSALLPNIVPREIFANAVALNSSANQIATISGPAFGGLLFAFGPQAVFSVTTVFFILSVLCLAAMQFRAAAIKREKVSWEYLTAGIGFIRRSPIVLGAITIDLFAVLLGGATALLPIYARDIFLADAFTLGLLRSAPAVGAFCMAIWIAWRPVNRKCGLRMFQAVAAFGLATIAFGLTTSIYPALLFLFIIGAADMISVYVRSTLVQIETPDEMRGRVSAVNSMFVGASNELGQFESGLLAAWLGPVAAVVIGGVGAIGVAAGGMKIFPELRARDRLVP